jgi:hypothetical protein
MVYAPERVGLLEKKKTRHYDAKWRNKNIFRAAVDDALHKLRALRDELNPWLMTMDALVNICLSGPSEDPAVIECCRQMADSIGERRKFEKTLLPQLRSSAKLRKAGAPAVQLVPGFLSGSRSAKALGKPGK